MPELPEVESLCRLLRSNLVGERITDAFVVHDPIIFKGESAEGIRDHLIGNRIKGVGRKGKFFWLEMEKSPSLAGHLGMSGWIQFIEPDTDHPRFTKLALTAKTKRLAFTDPRRLGRLWLTDDPPKDPQIKRLGFDAYLELPSAAALHKKLKRRGGPIKGALLDQSLVSGIGNYLADEILYQAKISPKTISSELTKDQVEKLRQMIRRIIEIAVEVGADESRFPSTWLFHHRWGGSRGPEKIGKHQIVREEVAGRTTAWVPAVQSPKVKA